MVRSFFTLFTFILHHSLESLNAVRKVGGEGLGVSPMDYIASKGDNRGIIHPSS